MIFLEKDQSEKKNSSVGNMTSPNSKISSDSVAISSSSVSISDAKVKELDSIYSSWGDTVHYSKDPKVFRGCEGSYMYDDNDTPYLDLQMMYSAANFGYRNQRITNAVIDQMNTMPQLTPKFLQPYKSLLSEKMEKMIEARFHEKGRMHFNVGGAQANEDAIKVVRNYTKRNGMFAFQGGYHGRTIAATCITSSFRYREKYGHFGDRANFVPFPYCFRCPYGMKCESCNHFCVKQFARNFESEYKAIYDPKTKECEYKAFIGEPILGTGGYINPPEWYWKEMKEVLDSYGIMLVIDEVQMGMFRTGKLWAIENYGIVPDVMTFAKSITNGMNPLAGFWAKEKYIAPDVFTPGSAHSTYCSNPIGVRAAYEVMSIVEEEEKTLEKEIQRKSALFMRGLNYLKSKYEEVGDVGGIGFALRMELTQKDGITPNRELCDALQEEGLKGDLSYHGKKCGLVLNNGGFFKNIITLVPQLYITDEEIEMSIDLLDQLLSRLTK